MSPVFAHGRLRLYLLKLLDESPRHGYEIIRLLQDRFLGVYAPSPGTVYPRLTRLERDGLVTHDKTEDRKVYRLTDDGRAELRSRLDELTDLEREIDDSVSDIAAEVNEDVRDTVRALRDDLKDAARDVRHQARDKDLQARWEHKRAWKEQQRAWRDAWKRDWGDDRAGWSDWAQEWAGDWRDWADKQTRQDGGRGGHEFERALREFLRDLTGTLRHGGPLDTRAVADARAIFADTLRRLRDEVLEPARRRHRDDH